MRVEVVVNGFFGGRFVRERLAVELPEGATLRELLTQVKRRTGLDLVRLAGAEATVMLAGRRLDLPAAAGARLADGDLLAALSPLGGG